MSPLKKFHDASGSAYVQMWVFRAILIIAVGSLAILGYQQVQTNQDIRSQNEIITRQNEDIKALALRQESDAIRLAVELCQGSRLLLSNVILRSVGATYAEYKQNPKLVLRRYREMLERSSAFQGRPELVEESVDRTRDVLEAASPEGCVTDG